MKSEWLLAVSLACLHAQGQPNHAPAPLQHERAGETVIQYLSGTDKDHTVSWNFFCTGGHNSGSWQKIPVPSQWEMEGFGNYAYGFDKVKTEEQGLYKTSFAGSREWAHKHVYLVFEGVMTDADVKINGQSAGAIHQGGFCEFSYDISKLLRQTANTLDVTVSKKSADKSIERAERGGDFWTLGGIYRPVYLRIVPDIFIDRLTVDASAAGNFSMNVFTKNTKSNQVIEAQVMDMKGHPISKTFRSPAVADSVRLQQSFSGISAWNPEKPTLYRVQVSIRAGTKILHRFTQRFGFRTAELRLHDGFYVNGKKIIFQGVNRHSAWPTSGKTLSRNIHLMDIGLMKEMNMNAVRMCHYPPDKEFLDLCDSLGLFVIDELTGWQAAYDTVPGHRLAKEMIDRDVNHPSVVIWANGNEGGWNRGLDSDFYFNDPQHRLVIHPFERFNGTDTKHYPDFNYISNTVLYGDDVFFPTEFMHGLYDGGLGAGLDDFWNEMRRYPHFAGGFLWSFHDEGILRRDKGDSMDTDGNHAPDGILGPYREKEASYYTIRDIWSPVQVHTASLPAHFDGRIEMENRYGFTNLKECRFEWKLVAFPGAKDSSHQARVRSHGGVAGPELPPGGQGFLQLSLPADSVADALLLTAQDPAGKEIFTWSWMLHSPETIAHAATTSMATASVVSTEDSSMIYITCDGIRYIFSKTTGYLVKVLKQEKEISFGAGPALAGSEQRFIECRHYSKGNQYFVEPVYQGTDSFSVNWIFASGHLPELRYRYKINTGRRDSLRETDNYMGITFDYPETKVRGMKWLGHGPYRVWKNRMKGQRFGVWEKQYNNAITGESWQYPEFKGWHSDVYWVTLQNSESNFTVYTGKNHQFLEMLHPQNPFHATNNYTAPAFPVGNIGFMDAISPIGTKFQPAELLGPQSQRNMPLNYTPVSGVLWFDFR